MMNINQWREAYPNINFMDPKPWYRSLFNEIKIFSAILTGKCFICNGINSGGDIVICSMKKHFPEYLKSKEDLIKKEKE